MIITRGRMLTTMACMYVQACELCVTGVSWLGSVSSAVGVLCRWGEEEAGPVYNASEEECAGPQ